MSRFSVYVFLGVVASSTIDASASGLPVDAADYVVWRRSYGYDCNGDGTVSTADYTSWRSRFGQIAAANTRNTSLQQWKGGDLNCDGKVDAADYVVWRKTLGS
jgi:hypothetical protein